MKYLLSIPFFISLFSSLSAQEESMTGDDLRQIIEGIAGENVEANGPMIHFNMKGVFLLCIYDESNDRMRIISPIIDYADVSEAQKDEMLISNFHSALDARYCVSDDVLYSAYVHPLSNLKPEDVIVAIYQVVSLNMTFGGEYSSGLLQFGDEDSEELQSI